MAVIQINDDWRINSDQYNWILQKRAVVKDTDIVENIGKENWLNMSYHPSLISAVKEIANQSIKAPAGVQGIADKLDSLYRLIEERFAGEPERNRKVETPEPQNGDDLDDLLS